MTRPAGRVYYNGKIRNVKAYADAVAANRGASKYIKARRAASKRAKQIREKSGPNSMEWVQSALFLYAVKKHGLHKDVRKAIWAYTSAMIVKLEEWVSNADKIAQRENIQDSFHWVALQLRSAVRNHMKLIDMFKDEVIVAPEVTPEGRRICGITHNPSRNDDYAAMTYIVDDFKRDNPDAIDILPEKDEQT